MTKKYQNRYRVPSARLKSWNYRWNAAYFITICTYNREHYFGEIVDGRMHFSEEGKIVETEWIKSSEIRPDMNLELGEFVIMPNHFHGIIIIGQNKFNCDEKKTNMENKNQFGPQSKNLASIIRGFKSAVTMQARQINNEFAWQPRFYDHIIRKNQFHKISEYIKNNPKKWKSDKFFK